MLCLCLLAFDLVVADDSSADGSRKLGERRGVYRYLQVTLQGGAENLELSKTAAEEDVAGQIELLCKERGPAADGVDDSQCNVALVCAFGKQADDFAFGKNGTHTGDIDWLVSFDKPVIIKSTTFSPLSSRIALQS